VGGKEESDIRTNRIYIHRSFLITHYIQTLTHFTFHATGKVERIFYYSSLTLPKIILKENVQNLANAMRRCIWSPFPHSVDI
jgi:hypothetical protein